MSNQLNIRLDDETQELLEVIAFLERESAGALGRRVMQDFLESKRDDPQVEKALRARVEYSARQSGALTSLDERRQSETSDT